MKRANRLLLGIMGTVLLVAIVAAVWQANAVGREERLSPAGRLARLLPGTMPGVKTEDLPLGPNEFVDATAKEKMDYDDVVFRSYTTEHGTFAVYIGYWAKGKRSPSHVAAHIPDRCWTLAGMTCLEKKADYGLAADGLDFEPTHWRRFTQPGMGEIETAFWHVVGDKFYEYGGRLQVYTPPLKRAIGVAKDLFYRREDQYFIRISSNQPLAEFSHDPAYIAVMDRVAVLGIRRR